MHTTKRLPAFVAFALALLLPALAAAQEVVGTLQGRGGHFFFVRYPGSSQVFTQFIPDATVPAVNQSVVPQTIAPARSATINTTPYVIADAVSAPATAYVAPTSYLIPASTYVPPTPYVTTRPLVSYAATPTTAEAAPFADRAALTIRVPVDAKVWIEGRKMSETGIDRRFVSPALDPAKTYSYDIRASWVENGREVNRNQEVRIHAGEQQRLTFVAGTK